MRCVIGVHDLERRREQLVVLDIVLHADLGQASTTDDLQETVDYHTLSLRIVEQMSGTRYRLLEAFAEHAARICLDSHDVVASATVRVRKPAALAGIGRASVEVAVTRRR